MKNFIKKIYTDIKKICFNFNKFQFYCKDRNNGSVLIIVIIISSILFSIGISFAFILEKEVLRQILGQRSQKALNIANSALECTLFNDFRRNIFSVSGVGKKPTFDCGQAYSVHNIDEWDKEYKVENAGTPSSRIYKFRVIETLNINNNLNDADVVPCAYVSVERKEKCEGPECVEREVLASVEVHGYDRCFDGHSQETVGQVVRRLKVFY